MKEIFSIVFNNVQNDSRVLKTAKTLTKFGEVRVLGFRYTSQDQPTYHTDGFCVDRPVLYRKDRTGARKVLAQAASVILLAAHIVAKHRNADIVVCNDLGALPLGLLCKAISLGRMKVVYDSHEYQSETSWVKGVKRLAVRIIESLLIRFADEVVVVSPSIAMEYQRLYGGRRPQVVLNCPPMQPLPERGALRQRLGLAPNTNVILYQGGLTPGRGIEQVLEAFLSLDPENAVLVFMGYGPLEELIRTVPSGKIRYIPAVPPSEVLRYTVDATFGLCILPNSCLNHYFCLPNKFFEYLMAGVPVIVSNLYELGRLVPQYELGVVASTDTVASLRDAIQAALEVGRDRYLEQVERVRHTWCWETQEEIWMSIARGLVHVGRRNQAEA